MTEPTNRPEQENRTNLRHNSISSGEQVVLPRWVWELFSRLLITLFVGAIATIFVTVFWLFVLTIGQSKTAKSVQNLDTSMQNVDDKLGDVTSGIKKIRKEIEAGRK